MPGSGVPRYMVAIAKSLGLRPEVSLKTTLVMFGPVLSSAPIKNAVPGVEVLTPFAVTEPSRVAPLYTSSFAVKAP